MYAWYNTPHNSLILELMFLRLNLVIRLIADPSLFSIYRETLTELYKPLEDPLITRCIEIMEFDENHNTQRSGMLKNIWSKVFPKPRRCWLPTGCLVRKLFKLFCLLLHSVFFMHISEILQSLNMQKLLEVLHDALPKMSLIASDFTFLPDVKVPGERAPLVSTKVCSFHTCEIIVVVLVLMLDSVHHISNACLGCLIKLSYNVLCLN